MADSQIIYQPYVAGARGALKAGTPVVCRTADEGLRRAERALAGGSILGAQVVRMVHDAGFTTVERAQLSTGISQLVSATRDHDRPAVP